LKLDGVWVQKGLDPKTGKNKFGIDWVATQLRLYHTQPIASKGEGTLKIKD